MSSIDRRKRLNDVVGGDSSFDPHRCRVEWMTKSWFITVAANIMRNFDVKSRSWWNGAKSAFDGNIHKSIEMFATYKQCRNSDTLVIKSLKGFEPVFYK